MTFLCSRSISSIFLSSDSFTHIRPATIIALIREVAMSMMDFTPAMPPTRTWTGTMLSPATRHCHLPVHQERQSVAHPDYDSQRAVAKRPMAGNHRLDEHARWGGANPLRSPISHGRRPFV